MNKFFTLSILIFSFVFCNAQNYSVGKRTISYVDASRSNRQIATDIYYPADVAGNDVPVATGNEKFPVVVFGHGFVIDPSSYVWLADSLVKYGYILALPSTEGGLSPSHDAFGKDLAFLCSYITSLNDLSTSFLYQRVINKSAVAGHSMGGGCSYLAAAANTSINAIFNFSAAETNPSAIAAATSISIPALVFSGSSDCIVIDTVQQRMYTNVIASCKTYIDINDALHCQFADNNGTCTLGQVLTGCNSSSITPAIVFNKVTSLLVPFLDYYLKDECSRGTDFTNAYDALTGATKLQDCSSRPSCQVLPVVLQNFTGKALNNIVTLNWNTASETNCKSFIVERSADGIVFSSLKEIQCKDVLIGKDGYSVLDSYPYPGNSFYRLKINNTDGSYSYSGVIKISTQQKLLALTKIFPNPIRNNIYFELTSDRQQKLNLSIYSAAGKRIFNDLINVNKGINEKMISFERQAAGYYILQFKDKQGNLFNTVKIIKR